MRKRADFNADLEFRTLLLVASQLDEITYENCKLKLDEDNTVKVEFNNYVDYTSAKKNQYYIYSLDSDRCLDDRYILYLKLKPDFITFENKYWIDSCKQYRNLMGITISIPLKRMIMFFYNLRDEDVLKYFDQCSDNIKDSIRHYFQLSSNRRN